MADFWIFVYTIEGYDRVAAAVPATLTVFYDLTLVMAGSPEEVFTGIVESTRYLNGAIRTDLECEVANDKSNTDASSPALLRRICVAFGPVRVPSSQAPPCLGVDMFGRRRRRYARTSKRSSRWRKAKITARTMQRWSVHLTNRLKRKAKQALLASSRPALAYSARVNGVSPSALLQARRLLAAQETPRCAGASLAGRLHMAKDPSWTMAVAPVLA